jgi:hypothetical protein
VILQHGQADVGAHTTPLNSTGAATIEIQAGLYQQAIESIIDFSLAGGADKVIVGASIADYNNADTTYEEGILGVGIDAALVTYSADSRVIAGAKLYDLMGLTYDHNAGNEHLNRDGIEEAGKQWAEFLTGTRPA